MDALAALRQRFAALAPVIDERTRRLLVAAESSALGRGGISIVSQVTGVSRQVIRQGRRELKEAPVPPAGRIRRAGGGRKKSKQKDASLVADLERLVEPLTRGDPESSLRWTCKSVRNLADELKRQGHKISYPVVAELLHELGYSLQSNRKTKEGSTHPDRNQQFEYINARVERAITGKQRSFRWTRKRRN
jgi:transposase